MSEADSPIILDSSMPDWIRTSGRRWSCRGAWRRGSALPWWGAPTAPSSWAAPTLWPLCPQASAAGEEQDLAGKWDRETLCLDRKRGNGWTRRAGEALLAPVQALPSEMVASLISLHPLWTQPAPPAGGTGKAGSCHGLLSIVNTLKLFFFMAVLWGAGREHPDRALGLTLLMCLSLTKCLSFASSFMFSHTGWGQPCPE